MASRRKSGEREAEAPVEVTIGPGVSAYEQSGEPEIDLTIPSAEPRLGPQRERRGRAEFHVRTGVQQLLHVARMGEPRKLEELATKLLRRAYGIG